MKDLDTILIEYPYCIIYENIHKNYSIVKYNDILLCKSINDVLICILQAFLSCIYLEKSIENDFYSSNTFEEMIEKYGLLPDISEEMKTELLSLLNEYKKTLINIFEGQNYSVKSTFELNIRNGEKIRYNIGMSAFHKIFMNFDQKNNPNNFGLKEYYGQHSGNYIYFYLIEKINENINIFHFRNYHDCVDHRNINHFIETRFLNKLKLSEKSKKWICESYKIIKDFPSSNIPEDKQNGFLINEYDFENINISSFIYIQIYVLNKRKKINYYIPSEPNNRVIENIQTKKKMYTNYFLFKKTIFYENLIPEIRKEIKSYYFFT